MRRLLKRWYPLVAIGRHLRTRNPQTFQEKVRYKMARDRRPLVTTFADKVAAREYAARKVGDEVLTRAYTIADSAESIDWSQVPTEFVCKVNHGSGGIVVVWSGADPAAVLPPDPERVGWETFVIHPDRAERGRIEGLCRRWLGMTYGWGPHTEYEWVYRNVPPRVLIEELLQDAEGRLPRDFRFYVMNGVCRLLQVETDWLGAETRRDFFTPVGQPIAVTSGKPRSEVTPRLPRNLDRMIEIAETLGEETDFVRVDLFNVEGRIVLGELTSTPGAGLLPFEPAQFSLELGEHWTVPRAYR